MKPRRNRGESQEDYQARYDLYLSGVEESTREEEVEPAPPSERSIALPVSEAQSLLDLVMDGQRLPLNEEEAERFRRLSRQHIVLEPGSLRVCSRQCPVFADCVWIKFFPEDQHPYNQSSKRCRVEAEFYEAEFNNAVEYVRSMDPEYEETDPDSAPVPKVELSICRDLAFQTVVERRLREEMAADPRATVNAPVPGAAGATKKEENPTIVAWTRAVEKKAKYQKDLFNMVQARLKRTAGSKRKMARSIEKVRDMLEQKKEEVDNDAVRNLLNIARTAVQDNAKREHDLGSRGDRSEETDEISD